MRIVSLLLASCLAGCVSEGVDTHASQTSGQFDLEWVILRDGAAISCVDAGASELALIASDSTESLEVVTGCYAGIGVLGPYPAGTYDLAVELRAPDGEALDAVQLPDVDLRGGQTLPLGAVEFER